MHEVKLDGELRVITPNEPGILGRVLGTLANAGVNLRALNVFSEGKKGVFRMVTSDNAKAQKHLKILGYEIKSNPVVTVLVEDRIGAGSEIGGFKSYFHLRRRRHVITDPDRSLIPAAGGLLDWAGRIHQQPGLAGVAR